MNWCVLRAAKYPTCLSFIVHSVVQVGFLKRHEVDAAFTAGYFEINAERNLPVRIASRFMPVAIVPAGGSSPVAISVQEELVKAYHKVQRGRETMEIVPQDCVRAIHTLVARVERLRAAAASSFAAQRPVTKPWALPSDASSSAHFGVLDAEYLRLRRIVAEPAVFAARDLCEREAQALLRLALRFAGLLRDEFAAHASAAPSAADIAERMVPVAAASSEGAGGGDDSDDGVDSIRGGVSSDSEDGGGDY
jgi:hypothetical protein